MPQQLTTRGRVGLVAATLGCLLVGAYGLALVASGFQLLPADIAANGLPLAVKIHVAAASVALVLVPWQLWAGIRARVPRVHRWMGRGYVVAALIGGVSGTAAATTTTHSAIAAAGFAALGVLWTLTTLAAVLTARRRDFTRHRRWAIRSFSLAFAAVTLRIYLALAGIAGIDFEIAYAVIAWVSWVPNLALAERVLRRPGQAATPHPTPPRGAGQEVSTPHGSRR